MKRRDFLKNTLAGSSFLCLNGMGRFVKASAPDNVWKDGVTGSSPYKALVCIMLEGGNDGINMLPPIPPKPGQSTAEYNFWDYKKNRNELAIKGSQRPTQSFYENGYLKKNPYKPNPTQSQLLADAYTNKMLRTGNNRFSKLGVNCFMPELAHLIKQEKVNVIANIGNLVGPIADKNEYFGQKKDLHPSYLFSHQHQQQALYTGIANNLNSDGWPGKLADLLYDVNATSFLNYSAGTTTSFGMGKKTDAVIISNILNFNYLNASDSARQEWLELIDDLKGEADSFQNNELNKLYSRSLSKQIKISEKSQSILSGQGKGPAELFADIQDSYGQQLFGPPSQILESFEWSSLEDTLPISLPFLSNIADIAKVIKLSSGSTGQGSSFIHSNRQIFFVSLPNFDTHGDQPRRHAALLRTLSYGIDSLQRAIDSMGLSADVTTYTMSDFGRTVRSNGSGTDHAWGSHSLVVGGAVKSGITGKLPNLKLASELDVGNKGRLIPQVSQDQLNKALLNWFGVKNSTINSILTNVNNFSGTPDLDLFKS